MPKPIRETSPIVCPYCGYEHEPSEAIYPEDLLGKPDSIVRDGTGKIIYRD